MIARIIHFLEMGIWEIRLRDLPSIKAFFVRALRIILLASRKMP